MATISLNNKILACVAMLFFFCQQTELNAQQVLNLNQETNLRFEKKYYNVDHFHSTVKPFLLNDSISIYSVYSKLQITRKGLLNRLLNENLIVLDNQSFKLYVNPIITVAPEYNSQSKEINNNYQFGISTGGKLGKKLAFQVDGFYGLQSFDIEEELFIDSMGTLPHFGKYIKKEDNNYHYFGINAYLSYTPWKYLNLQTGIGKNFWGEGYRSLFLSDNPGSYPFVKATVDVWKFKYLWLFGALRDYDSNYQDDKLRNKLLFSHYLSWNATKWLNINFFESVISNPVDSAGVTYFNVNYLNPVIFMRPVEFSGGSADNAILGFGAKLKLRKKYQLYGQFVVDEFIWAEMTSGEGWWGNKFGVQAGVKIFDLFNIENLFSRLEYNRIMPYTYSYSNSILNYGIYGQALAHPSGANFEELIFQLHYHKKRYSVELKALHCIAGIDNDSISFGKDIYKSYELRRDDYGNKLGQGFSANYTNILLKTSYMINPKAYWNFFLSLNYKKIHTPIVENDLFYITLGIRMLIFNQTLDFL